LGGVFVLSPVKLTTWNGRTGGNWGGCEVEEGKRTFQVNLCLLQDYDGVKREKKKHGGNTTEWGRKGKGGPKRWGQNVCPGSALGGTCAGEITARGTTGVDGLVLE